MEYSAHYSVLNKEVIDFLTENVEEKSYFADLTFGAGGHSFALAEKSDTNIVFSVDQDPEAFENGLELIMKKGLSGRVNLLKMNFSEFHHYAISELDIVSSHGGFKGVVIDLGVSSHHFDKGERGFSFRFDAPLDMRMAHDRDDIMTASHIVNEYLEEDLANVIFEYGEERLSRRIAKNIVEARAKSKISTTKELEEIIFHSYPKKSRHGKIHPATRTFQALRIAVNRELDVLDSTIQEILPLLSSKGRLAIISFHSLEDRIVKHSFKNTAKDKYKVLTKRPIIPSEEEILENSRSRSAKLRVIEKL